MLTDNELKNLLNKAQTGDKAASECILTNNLNLVRSITHRFMNRGYEWDDLFQIGCMGLVKAIDRFDTTFNVKFSTYAVPMIIGEIRRYMRDDNPIKVSRPIKELATRIYRVQEKLHGTLGREPTIREIAEELILAPEEIVAALEAVQPPQSLYDNASHDNGDTPLLVDQIKYSDGQDNEYFEKLALQEVIGRLPKRERKIIYLRFFEDRTQAEIASEIGISQVQVSRLERQALKLIKDYLQTS
ncbi:MAG: RNA polymerase sporulation sigma factor SigF [Pelosinus sp.]|nr:RNA polymerase sporulation sigma factor SigF [Pelosinus sp.]